MLRPEEPLFFANAEPVMTQVRELVLRQPAAKLLVLSLEESPDLDSTALENIAEFCSWFAARGGQLRVARLKESAREALLRAGVAQLHAGDAGLFKRGRCGTRAQRAPSGLISCARPKQPLTSVGGRCWGSRPRLRANLRPVKQHMRSGRRGSLHRTTTQDGARTS